MYLQFKEKINSFRNDEFERNRLMNRLQTGFVAAFWIGFSIALLHYGHEKELKEKAAFKPPTVPDVLSPTTPVAVPVQKAKGN